MAIIEDIPPEIRWQIATKSANTMPFVYDMFFRKVLGDRVEDIELQIWVEGGKEVKNIANELGLPAGNAIEVNDALGIVSTILLGPELKSEIVNVAEDKVVERITGCPMLNRAKEMEQDAHLHPAHCQAYCRSAVDKLNPNYAQRFDKRMCDGDPYCENVVELRW